MQRCGWVSKDPIYIDYHDNQWGVPCTDNLQLFEMLCLEGQQAGLSWITVLKKRQHYRQRFHNFDPLKIISMSEQDIASCLLDPGLIRNRLKIAAIINNAHAYLAMQQQGDEFSRFIWSFVNDTPILYQRASLQEVPAKTETSEAMSKALKQRGFKFVGSTICYAFMQACGLVNDHVTSCYCHPVNQ